jgi:hypothetical protein
LFSVQLKQLAIQGARLQDPSVISAFQSYLEDNDLELFKERLYLRFVASLENVSSASTSVNRG